MDNELTSIIKNSFLEIENKNYKSAIEMLYPKLVDYPDNIEIITQIAKCYYLMGEKEQAVEYYEKAFELDNYSTVILDPLIELKIKQYKYNEAESYAQYYLECKDRVYAIQMYLETLLAIKHYDRVIEFSNSINEAELNSSAYSTITEAIIEKGKADKNTDIENAQYYASKAIESDRNNVNALCVLAKCYVEKEEYQKVYEIYNNNPALQSSSEFISIIGYIKYLTGDYATASEYYSKAIELNDTNITNYNNLATAYVQQGWFKEAEIVAKRGLAIKEDCVDLRLTLANIYYMKNDFDKTLLTLAYISDIEPDNVEMNLLYAYSYAHQDNFIKAEFYAKKIENKVKTGLILESFAKIHFQLNHKEKAFELIDKAIEQAPEDINFLSTKADFLVAEGKEKESLEITDKIIEINPNYVDAYYQKALYYCNYEDNNENALKYALKAVELDCNNDIYQSLLAKIYSDLGEHDKAIDCARFSLSITPDNIDKYCFIGNEYIKKNEIDIALTYFDEILKINPNDFQVMRDIARILEHNKLTEQAYEYYQKAYRTEPYDYEFLIEYSDFVIENISAFKGINLLLNFSKYSRNKSFKIDSKNRAKKLKKELSSKLTLQEKIKLLFK